MPIGKNLPMISELVVACGANGPVVNSPPPARAMGTSNWPARCSPTEAPVPRYRSASATAVAATFSAGTPRRPRPVITSVSTSVSNSSVSTLPGVAELSELSTRTSPGAHPSRSRTTANSPFRDVRRQLDDHRTRAPGPGCRALRQKQALEPGGRRVGSRSAAPSGSPAAENSFPGTQRAGHEVVGAAFEGQQAGTRSDHERRQHGPQQPA